MSDLNENSPSPVNSEDCAKKALEFYNKGDMKSAIEFAKLAIDQDSTNELMLNLMGVLFKQTNDIKKAIKYFNLAISINNKNPNYYFNLGVVQRLASDITGALESQYSALSLSDNNPLYLNEVGLLHIQLNQLDKAKHAFLKAYQVNSDDITTCINLSHIYELLGDIRSSIDFSTKAMKINPDRPESYNNLGKALITANFHEQGINYIKQAYLKGCEEPAKIHQSILMNMLYPDCYSPEQIFAAHKDWANTHLDQNQPQNSYQNIERNKSKRLNIGFISPDLKAHSVSYFLIPILEAIDHDQFSTFCYTTSNTIDSVTEHFKNISDHWRNITSTSDTQCHRLIQEDNIDILIDLAGHSLNSSMGIFNQKPAPVQISYLGYPASTGLNNIKYRITDNYADPEHTTDHLHTEKLIRIEPSFLCYKPDRSVPISKKIPFETNNYITFGSFNNFSKLSRTTIQIWSGVLLAIKNSRILLKNSKPIPDLLRDNLLTLFGEFGISPERTILHHAINDKTDHMAYYNNIDICLDPTPYNGTTTTYEALYMGVPVITLAGKSHQNRVGCSILSSLNLPNLVANSYSEYIDIATSLSLDIPQLQSYRRDLRDQLLSSPLTDSNLFTSKFEGLLRNTWETFCDAELTMLSKQDTDPI